MPWCPKCKSEYRDGFKICADCGCELVAEKPVEGKNSPASQKKRQRLMSEGFPLSDKAREGEEWPEDSGGWVEGESEDREGFGEGRELPEGEMEKAEPVQTAAGSLFYQDSSERASENRSSAWILLIVGIIGITVVILGTVGLLPFRLGNPYLFYGVMGAVFILFLVAGVISMKNAWLFAKKAESENSLRSTLLDWCRESLGAESIDAAVRAEGDTEEILYFKRFNYIKERLNHQFVNLDQGFLEKFIDDFVYVEIFEDGQE